MIDAGMILPGLAGTAGLFAGGVAIYKRLRPIFPVQVNCWFCNGDGRVPYYNKDNFVCPHCGQYNGFTEDGDYNQDIPAMYCEGLNSPPNSFSSKRQKKQNGKNGAKSNELCHECNLNQTMKLRAIADYTPIREENYDQEIKEYRERLDKTYALCRDCEAALHQTLGKQDSWLKPKLIAWRLKQSLANKKNVIQNSALLHNNIRPHQAFLRFLGLLLVILLLLLNIHSTEQIKELQLNKVIFDIDFEPYLMYLDEHLKAFVSIGILLFILTISSFGMDLNLNDGIASFTWVGLLALVLNPDKLSPQTFNLTKIGLSGILLLTHLWPCIRSQNKKKVTTPSKAAFNINNRSNYSYSEANDSRSQLNGSIGELRSNNISPSMSMNNSYEFSVKSNFNDESICNSKSQLDDTLCNLNISDPNRLNKSSPNFPSRNLFSDTTKVGVKKRNVISPSRFNPKHVTQSSWVAGGYWGSPGSPQRNYLPRNASFIENRDKGFYQFPLSRTSSQSSGFVSHNSNGHIFNSQGPYSMPSSRQGSLCGDFDRNSVLSEPPYFWNTETNQLNNLLRQSSQSDLQSVYNAPSIISETNSGLRTPSPCNSTFIFPETSCKSLNASNNENNKDSGGLNYRNPFIAFVLGLSVAANLFLALILLKENTFFK